MPAQLATILYVSNYRESTSPNFIIGSAIGITSLDDGDSVQTFNLTIFYPIEPSVPCYVPRIADSQVLSINNCKFSLGKGNEINVNKQFFLIYFHNSYLFKHLLNYFFFFFYIK